MNIGRVVRRGLRFIVLMISEKTRESNHLRMQHFLLSYLKTLSVGPDLPRDSPVLNQLSHRCVVIVQMTSGFFNL